MRFLFFTIFMLLAINIHSTYGQPASKLIKVDTDYQKGTLTDGYKSGVWQYFDKIGELSLKVDYDLERVTFIRKDTVGMYAIEKEGNWVQSSLDVQPRYLGSIGEIYRILMTNIRYPSAARQNSTTGTLYLMFEVDTTGQAVNHQIMNDLGDHCGKEVLRAFALVPNLWTVASKDRKLYRSRIILPINFSITLDGREVSPRYKKKNQQEIPLAWQLPAMEVKAMGVSRTSIH